MHFTKKGKLIVPSHTIYRVLWYFIFMYSLLKLSETIAREAHAGQLYDGRDYVDAHVAPIVHLISKMGYGENFQAVGWLHDVPEESDITTDDLLERNIPDIIVTPVDLLTKKGEAHQVYLGKIATNPMAVVGKYADSSINLANTILRAAQIDIPRFRRRLNTYTGNLAFLLPLLHPTD